jgi:hypothetical protein
MPKGDIVRMAVNYLLLKIRDTKKTGSFDPVSKIKFLNT